MKSNNLWMEPPVLENEPMRASLTERDKDVVLDFYRERCARLGRENEALRKAISKLEVLVYGRAS